MKKTMIWMLLILGIGTSANAFAQKKSALAPIAGDCSKAIKLNLDKLAFYGPTAPADGHGTEMEISTSDKKSLYFFEQEHNTAWYVFDVKKDGLLVFEITPLDPKDDYDFILFKSDSGDFCNQIKEKKIMPIRTNISRVNVSISGRTGLSGEAKNEYMRSGIGNPFSKALSVKEGERYYLVLDNTSIKGSGHILSIGYEKKVEFGGVVLNEENKPIEAEITVEDERHEIKKIHSDPKTGKYKFSLNLMQNRPYILNIVNDNFFVSTKEFKVSESDEKNKELVNIKTILPKLKKGGKYTLGSINFKQGSADLLLISYPSVISLYKLMKKNPKMIIQIQGHVNHPFNKGVCDDPEHQRVSEARAKTVYDILLSKNIKKERLSYIGFGDKEMLYPEATTEQQREKNRRVEIMVVSVK